MSLRVWLPLNGDLRNQGLDGGVSVTNSGATIDNSGKIGKCYEFNGVDQYFNINNLDCLNWENFSFSCWCYPTNNFNYLFLIRGSNQHRVRISGDGFMFRDNNNTSSQRVVSFGQTIPINTWTHLVCIYARGEIFIYINGTLTSHSTAYYHSNSHFLSDLNQIRIARQQSTSSNNYYAGKINDIRIYDHALSEKEVKEIAKGLILHYKLEDQKCGIYPNLIQSSKTTFHSTQEWTGTGWASSFMTHDDLMAFLKPSTTYTFSWDGEIVKRTSVPTKYSLQMGFLFYSASNGSANRSSQKNNQTEAGIKHHISTTFITPSVIPDDYRIIYYTNRYTTNGSSPVGFDTVKFSNIKLEENDSETQYILSDSELNINSNIIEDCSGYFNNATVINNVSYLNDAPKYKTNVFLANSSTIKVLTNDWVPQGMEAMTINVWAKNTSWAKKHIFSCTESGGFNTEGGTSGYLRFPINVYTNAEKTSHAYKYDSKEIEISKLSTTDWNMLTFVYDNTGTRTYINGELHHTHNYTSYGIFFNMNARLFLGCEANSASPSTPYFNGSLSDFRIYCTALSADDIKELYQTSASIDDKQNFYSRELSNSLHDTTSITQAGITLADDFVEDAVAAIKDDRSIESNCFYEY